MAAAARQIKSNLAVRVPLLSVDSRLICLSFLWTSMSGERHHLCLQVMRSLRSIASHLVWLQSGKVEPSKWINQSNLDISTI